MAGNVEEQIEDPKGRESDPEAQRAAHFHNQIKESVGLHIPTNKVEIWSQIR